MPKQPRPLRIEGPVAYVPLNQGREAIIDAADAQWIGQWTWSATGYGLQTGNGCVYATRHDYSGGRPIGVRMHRLLLSAPAGVEVDHINGNGLDNRRANLRLATRAENAQNRRKPRQNRSGYKGVSQWGDLPGWCAHIQCDGVRYFLGAFPTPEEAHQAYKKAADELHGRFANYGAVSVDPSIF